MTCFEFSPLRFQLPLGLLRFASIAETTSPFLFLRKKGEADPSLL
jgi:hypothetical protein